MDEGLPLTTALCIAMKTKNPAIGWMKCILTVSGMRILAILGDLCSILGFAFAIWVYYKSTKK